MGGQRMRLRLNVISLSHNLSYGKSAFHGQITHFKIPRCVRFVDEYPMTVTGKLQKFAMREMMTKELACTAT